MRLIYFIILLGVLLPGVVLGHQPRVVVSAEEIIVESPEVSQAFYSELKGESQVYVVSSSIDFNLYVNLLAPKASNPDGRYSARIYQGEIATSSLFLELKAENANWQEFYEPFGADYYLKGPEIEVMAPADVYYIEVFNETNQGKYVLVIGKKEEFPLKEIINTYRFLPKLKMQFFNASPLLLLKSPLVFIPLIVIVLIIFIIAFIIRAIRKRQQK